MTQTMKAVRFHEHGGPDVLRYEDAPAPTPGHGEVLVEVRACALNRLDVWVRSGARGWQIPMPHILGADISGVVVELGQGVEKVQTGMECFVHPGRPGGASMHRFLGDDNIAEDYAPFGVFVDGGYAQYVVVPADNIMPKPARLSWEETAAFPLTFLTAWHMLGPRRGDLKSGETLLVMGASSGVGTAAIQLAKARGAYVITTVGGTEKITRTRELGADEVINHYAHAGEIHKCVYELTGGRGVDMVVEHVGAQVFMQCVKSLRRGGRLVTCGTTTGGQFEVDMQMVYAKHLTLLGSFMGSMGETLQYLPLVERGLVKPIIDRVYPLEHAADAHMYMVQPGGHFGKIVLKV
jgi:NADPH:quinone reductase-like Zn-dependent oxidoreductase